MGISAVQMGIPFSYESITASFGKNKKAWDIIMVDFLRDFLLEGHYFLTGVGHVLPLRNVMAAKYFTTHTA